MQSASYEVVPTPWHPLPYPEKKNLWGKPGWGKADFSFAPLCLAPSDSDWPVSRFCSRVPVLYLSWCIYKGMGPLTLHRTLESQVQLISFGMALFKVAVTALVVGSRALGAVVKVPDVLHNATSIAESTSGPAMDGMKLEPVAANATTFDWWEAPLLFA